MPHEVFIELSMIIQNHLLSILPKDMEEVLQLRPFNMQRHLQSKHAMMLDSVNSDFIILMQWCRIYFFIAAASGVRSSILITTNNDLIVLTVLAEISWEVEILMSSLFCGLLTTCSLFFLLLCSSIDFPLLLYSICRNGVRNWLAFYHWQRSWKNIWEWRMI